MENAFACWLSARPQEVLKVSDDGLQLQVRCGVMRSTVELSSIESLDGRKPESPVAPVVQVQVKARRGSGSAEVRTSKGTPLMCVDCVSMRPSQRWKTCCVAPAVLWVIHGIGTGKLKRGLRDWFQSLPYVGGTSC